MLLHEVVAGAIYATVIESGYFHSFHVEGYTVEDVQKTVDFLGFQEAFEVQEDEGVAVLHYVWAYGDGTLHEEDSEMYCVNTVENDNYYKNLVAANWHDLYWKVRKK